MPALKAAAAVGSRSLSPLWELDLGACPEALALTADGRQLAIGSTEGSLRICDADTGLVHHARQAHTRGLSALACGGPLLASGGQDGALRLWCPDAGTLLAEAHFGRAWVEHLIFAPDSRALAAGAGRTVCVLERDGRERWRHSVRSPVRALACNPSGSLLAVGGVGGATLLRMDDGSVHRELPKRAPLLSLAFSPDGRVLAAGTGDNTVHFWRLSGPDAGSEMSGFEGPPFRPVALAWHGTTLATGGDTTIALWSFRGKGPEGTEPRGLVAHRALVTHLAFAEKTGALASASRGGELMLWDSPRSSEPAGGIRLDGAVTALCLRPDGTRLFAGAERGLVLACRMGERPPES